MGSYLAKHSARRFHHELSSVGDAKAATRDELYGTKATCGAMVPRGSRQAHRAA